MVAACEVAGFMTAGGPNKVSELFIRRTSNKSRVSVQCYGLMSQGYNVAMLRGCHLLTLAGQSEKELSDSTMLLLL